MKKIFIPDFDSFNFNNAIVKEFTRTKKKFDIYGSTYYNIAKTFITKGKGFYIKGYLLLVEDNYFLEHCKNWKPVKLKNDIIAFMDITDIEEDFKKKKKLYKMRFYPKKKTLPTGYKIFYLPYKIEVMNELFNELDSMGEQGEKIKKILKKLEREEL